jgi:hypothetical protein
VGVALALGRAMLQAKVTCLVMVLPAKRREGQRMFWRLHFAWRCGIKIIECGSIIRTLPEEKKALAGIPTPFAADSGFAACGYAPRASEGLGR